MRIARFIVRPACIIVGLLAVMAGASAQELTGTWTGQYMYEDGRRAVEFKASIISADAKFWGSITEPRTFGANAAQGLSANIFGDVAGNRVSFRKNYDGTGGVNHWVQYTGALDQTNRRIDGVWSIDGGKAMGRFSMTRID